MKDEKTIELPDGLDLCDDCGFEYPAEEIETCSGCHKKVCKFCLDLHSDMHYYEQNGGEIQ